MQQIDIIQELSDNFIEYSAAVNSDRAIPDAKSGLKPVARRILWGALSGGRISSKPHVKCANIVGEVMAKLHPHGDSSIYGALVRLSQNWVMRYPLIDGHGNFGNIDGDDAAAARYTEARLTKLAEEGMLKGIKKNNVDFIPNYDETDNEPITLPAIFPNLLCNPNMGIGVALAANWACHNLREVADAIYDYMDGKEPTLPGPDFPTGGLIINGKDLPQIISKGRGSVKIRGKYKIEKQNIIFYEVPYGIKVEELINDIGKLCEEEKLINIADIRNESNKKGLRIVIECEKGINPESIVVSLFKETSLETSFSYNQVALVDKVPTELGLKDCIEIYLNHNIDCLKRETQFDLDKAKDRKEIVDGLLKCLEDIDNIITLIKKSESAAKAKDNLKEKYKFSEAQAKAIVDMKLGKLAGLERIQLEEEQKQLSSEIESLSLLLTNKDLQINTIRLKLKDIVDRFGDNRRTEITNIETKKEKIEKPAIEKEDVVVVVTQKGYIKRVPRQTYKPQSRNRKGTKSQDDLILYTESLTTLDNISIFTSDGKAYKLLVNDIPETKNTSAGTSLYSLINLPSSQSVKAVCKCDKEELFITFITEKGLIKKTFLTEFKNVKKKNGIVALKLKEDDNLVDVIVGEDANVVVTTECGYAIKFSLKDVNPTGRATCGVKAINLEEGDVVKRLHYAAGQLAILKYNGTGNRIKIEDIPLQKRSGKGVIIAKNPVADTCIITDENKDILISGEDNTLCIKIKDIPLTTRTANGNILIKTSKANTINEI